MMQSCLGVLFVQVVERQEKCGGHQLSFATVQFIGIGKQSRRSARLDGSGVAGVEAQRRRSLAEDVVNFLGRAAPDGPAAPLLRHLVILLIVTGRQLDPNTTHPATVMLEQSLKKFGVHRPADPAEPTHRGARERDAGNEPTLVDWESSDQKLAGRKLSVSVWQPSRQSGIMLPLYQTTAVDASHTSAPHMKGGKMEVVVVSWEKMREQSAVAFICLLSIEMADKQEAGDYSTARDDFFIS
ncbi:hypothetical protein L3Q82_000584 [Scortum barcoo]|uniref:Uncharacterized protein n=1 Tax=Scortum barcoo TaxID=214431 RepID=A0ACB8WGP9_9TELE|nr:hypothetical protein L3Q82_000584 [Scortum barcoo]